jgi:hypothetical protein
MKVSYIGIFTQDLKVNMFKPLILFFLFITLISSSSFAQAPDTYPRSFIGLYLGPNLSGFTGNYSSNIEGESGKIRIRTQYGLFTKIYIQKNIGVFTGLELVLNGALTKNKDSNSATVSISYIAKTNLSTFSIPALFAFTPRPEYGLLIGPQMDMILSANEPWNRSDVIMPPDYEENIIEKYNVFGVSIAFGGYYYLLNGSSFHLRYTQGVSNMTKAEYGNAKPYSIQFFIGINIYKK